MFAFIALSMGSCTQPQRPDLYIPIEYTVPENLEAEIDPTNSDETLMRWWELFDDITLSNLIYDALCYNYDLRLARERVCQARAILTGTAAILYPQVNGIFSANRFRNSQTAIGFISSSGDIAEVNTGLEPITNFYQIGFDATWELDFFGRNADTTHAAVWDMVATHQQVRDVHVTVASEVARTYMDIRADQAAIKVIKNHIEIDSELVRLLELQFRSGYTSAINLESTKALLEQRNALLKLLEQDLIQNVYALAVLVGMTPEKLLCLAEDTQDYPKAIPSIPLGIPPDLLCRRGDIRQREANLLASLARLSSARKEILPTILLNTFWGYNSSFINLLFRPESRTWNLGVNVTQPVFDGGSILANINLTTSVERQAALAYEQSILVALAEVDTALSNYSKEKEKNVALQRAVASYREARDLALKQYFGGFADYLYVLNNEVNLYISQLDLVNSENDLNLYLISLYKALGGGWECAR